VDERGGTGKNQREEQSGSDVSHSFIPYFIHRTHLLRICFIACCFLLMFMFCSVVNPLA
jgi:hypothetical protein